MERVFVDLVRIGANAEFTENVAREILRHDVVRVRLVAVVWSEVAETRHHLNAELEKGKRAETK